MLHILLVCAQYVSVCMHRMHGAKAPLRIPQKLLPLKPPEAGEDPIRTSHGSPHREILILLLPKGFGRMIYAYVRMFVCAKMSHIYAYEATPRYRHRSWVMVKYLDMIMCIFVIHRQTRQIHLQSRSIEIYCDWSDRQRLDCRMNHRLDSTPAPQGSPQPLPHVSGQCRPRSCLLRSCR